MSSLKSSESPAKTLCGKRTPTQKPRYALMSVGVLLRRSKLHLGVADKPLVGAASRREEKDSAMPVRLGLPLGEATLRRKTT